MSAHSSKRAPVYSNLVDETGAALGTAGNPLITGGSGAGGNEKVEITSTNGDAITQAGSSDALVATLIGLLVNARLMGFNGATWDRLQVDANKNLKVTIESSTVTQGVQIVGSDIMVPIQYQGSVKGIEEVVTASTPIAAAGDHVTAWIDASNWEMWYPQVVLDRAVEFDIGVEYANDISGAVVMANEVESVTPAAQHTPPNNEFMYGIMPGPFIRLTITNKDAASVNLTALNIRWDTAD